MPFLDWLLFSDLYKEVVTLNIGGISNISYIPKNKQKDKVLGFDTGPGMSLIDEYVKYEFNEVTGKIEITLPETEEFAFEQGFRYRAAVGRNQGLPRPHRFLVDRASNELLARPAVLDPPHRPPRRAEVEQLDEVRTAVPEA